MNKQQTEIQLSSPVPQHTLLCLDTSSAVMTIALVRGNDVIGTIDETAERNHSIKLVPNLSLLLERHEFKLSDIDGIAAGWGPGSYTGVRIGVTVAKTIAWSQNLPLVGVSSLEALALGAVNSPAALASANTWVIPMMNARRGRAYTNVYLINEGLWRPVLSDGIRNVQNYFKQLQQMFKGQNQAGENRFDLPYSIVLTGDVEDFADEIGLFIDEVGRYIDDRSSLQLLPAHIEAKQIAQLAGHRFEQAYTGDLVHDFSPNYTQLAEAEVKWKAQYR